MHAKYGTPGMGSAMTSPRQLQVREDNGGLRRTSVDPPIVVKYPQNDCQLAQELED